MNEVHNIKLPTLVLCGSEDEMTPVKYTRYLAERIQAARQAIIQGAGHFVFVEKAKEVNQAIEEFLESSICGS
jgi:pimeloyl-ACP methyl ester carboxylesterase